MGGRPPLYPGRPARHIRRPVLADAAVHVIRCALRRVSYGWVPHPMLSPKRRGGAFFGERERERETQRRRPTDIGYHMSVALLLCALPLSLSLPLGGGAVGDPTKRAKRDTGAPEALGTTIRIRLMFSIVLVHQGGPHPWVRPAPRGRLMGTPGHHLAPRVTDGGLSAFHLPTSGLKVVFHVSFRARRKWGGARGRRPEILQPER